MIKRIFNLTCKHDVSLRKTNRRKRATTRPCPQFERLQRRELLAADAFIQDETLFVQGSENDDFVRIVNNDIVLAANPTVDVIVEDNAGNLLQQFTFDRMSIRNLEVDLFAGDDTLRIETNVTSMVRLGDGDDFMEDSTSSRSTVFGGNGDDQIILGNGYDAAQNPFDGMSPEQITNTIDQMLADGDIDSDSFLAAQLSELPATHLEWLGLDNLDSNTYLVAALADEDIAAEMFENTGIDFFGTKTAFGEDGNDSLHGSTGADDLFGGNGNDLICGGAGNDMIDAGSGYDVAWGDEGDDVLLGGDDFDRLSGGEGDDNLLGGSGDDDLFGDAGDDTLNGAAGNDELVGGDGSDTLDGGDGDDRMAGDVIQLDPNSVFWTTITTPDAGDDLLIGGLGNDLLVGGGGDDSLAGNAGADRLFGDQAAQFNSYGQPNWNGDLEDSTDGQDDLDGGAGDDLLVGGGQDDTLLGNEGQDVLIGASGNDQLDGGSDNDQLFGDQHETIIWYAAQQLGAGGNPSTTGGGDELVGGPGDDLLVAGAGTDTLHGNAGDDTLDGGAGDDALFGDAGEDLLVGDSPVVQPGTGLMTVPAGNDTLDGGDDDDQLSGQAGDDQLTDHAGFNILAGDEGDDTYDTTGAGIRIDNAIMSIYGTDEADGITVRQSGTDLEVIWSTANDYRSKIVDDSMIGFIEIIAGEGDDTLANETAIPCRIQGGAGDDMINVQAGDNTLDGGAGNDQIQGGTGADIIFGRDGDDNLNGNAGNDILDGGNDDDVLQGGLGDDQHFGGTGSDLMQDNSSDADSFDQDGSYNQMGTWSLTPNTGNTSSDMPAQPQQPTSSSTTSLTLSAAPTPIANAAAQEAAKVARQFGLESVVRERQNFGRLNETWLQARNGDLFFVTPDGTLYEWNGSRDLTASPRVAKLSKAVRLELIQLLDRPTGR